MVDVKYVVRVFSADDKYLYSVHCTPDILDEVIEYNKSSGHSVKIVAFRPDESEV